MVISMDEFIERQMRLSGASFFAAIVANFINLHREHYGTQADSQDVTNFCLKFMFSYKGESFGINSEETKSLILKCMYEAKEWRIGA